MRLFLILMLCYVAIPRTSMALSFLDKEHSKKLAKEAKKEKITRSYAAKDTETPYSMSPLQLFQSPIQPGGKYMLNVNLVNLLSLRLGPKHSFVQRLTQGLSAMDRYAENLVETDERVVAFRNDPTPRANWKNELKELKASLRIEYRAYVAEMAVNGH